MNGHKIFKTPIRPVIMIIIGLNFILGDLLLAVIMGIGIYMLMAWLEKTK